MINSSWSILSDLRRNTSIPISYPWTYIRWFLFRKCHSLWHSPTLLDSRMKVPSEIKSDYGMTLSIVLRTSVLTTQLYMIVVYFRRHNSIIWTSPQHESYMSSLFKESQRSRKTQGWDISWRFICIVLSPIFVLFFVILSWFWYWNDCVKVFLKNYFCVRNPVKKNTSICQYVHFVLHVVSHAWITWSSDPFDSLIFRMSSPRFSLSFVPYTSSVSSVSLYWSFLFDSVFESNCVPALFSEIPFSFLLLLHTCIQLIENSENEE